MSHFSQQTTIELAMVAHTCNISIQEAEIRGLRVQGQLDYIDRLCLKIKTKQQQQEQQRNFKQ
jgi:hypothetical protein